MAETEMTIRILKMYEDLRIGREIQKLSFCLEHGISERTFDRDIEKIRFFLSEEYSGNEVVYCQERACYLIPGMIEKGELSMLEFTIIVKILKGGQILEKNEFGGLLHSLRSVTERGMKDTIQQFIQKEFGQYIEKEGRRAFLKLFGDLQKCIWDRNIIRIKREATSESMKDIRFCPVAIEYFPSKFYLLGYQIDESERLSVFVLEEIESFQTTSQKYSRDIYSS